MSVSPEFEIEIPIVVVGAGGCGLSAALACRDAGVEVLVLERTSTPLGSTAMSSGMIPAAGTPEQRSAGIDDAPSIFFSDIMGKTKGQADPAMVLRLAEASAETVAWLKDRHAVPLSLVDGFLYPGHSRRRMYATPARSGAELMGCLQAAAAAADVDLMTDATVTEVHGDDDGRVRGVTVSRPDGSKELIGCRALILACCGYGGAPDMVKRWIPEMADALYHGHPGNLGDAVRWGEQLGAAVADMSGYQGHGGVSAGHGVLIMWPLIMEGGFQVNALGRRFSNEALGYSEQAAKVNAQPERFAWSLFDERRHQLMLQFEDYRDALSAGAIVKAATVIELAERTRLPPEALAETLRAVEAVVSAGRRDEFGRDFAGKAPLAAPYYAAKVVGALLHTQGGLVVDADAQVLRPDGSRLPNLFAGGGAARGVSGAGAEGYMAGNGLLTATTLGRLAGRAAARLVAGSPT